MLNEKALARNTAIQILGKLATTIVGLGTVAILGRYIGLDGYGQFTIVLSFLSIFAVIVDFGLTLTTTQMISEHEADEKTLLSNLLSLRIVSAIVFLALAPLIALAFPYERIILVAIAVGAISYLFGTTSQMLIGVFQKRMLMTRVILAELTNRGVVLLGVIMAPALNLGLIGIMWLLVLGNGLQLLIMIALARQYIKFRFQSSLLIWKKIIGRSWPIGVSIFFNLIYMRGDIIFLSLFRPDAEIGIYGAAYKVVDVVTTIPVMYMGLLLPLLVSVWSKVDKTTFQKLMQQSFDFFSIVAIPILFGSIAIGTPLMVWIYGVDFVDSGRVLAILGVAITMVFFSALFGHAIVALQKQKPMTWGYVAVAILTVTGYLYLIPRFGMWGAAWVTLFSETLIAILTFTVVKKVSDFRPKLDLALRALLASLVMYLALFLAPQLHIILLLPVGMLVYASALTLLGGPRPRDVIKLFLA